MPAYLDIDTWNRRESFRFFRLYEQPWFNICAHLRVAPFLDSLKSSGHRFFPAALYAAGHAANAIPEFRYRLRGERILVHDQLNLGSTVLRDNGTFGFCYFDYGPSFRAFMSHAEERLLAFKNDPDSMNPREDDDAMLHFSIIPWIAFTSFAHARRTLPDDSVPKIVLGKYHLAGDQMLLPVSVEVHHALMDGLHVGRFFEYLQAILDAPDVVLTT